MKHTKITYIIVALIALALYGCEADDEKMKPVGLTNLYEILPNTTDSIQTKRYEIYQKHGVSVYFNDTIASHYYGQSLAGDSIFIYETIDMAWRYTGRSDNYFNYHYMKDETQMMESLKFIDKFLELTSKPLRPLSILVTDSVSSSAKLQKKLYTYANQDSTIVFSQQITFYTGSRSIVFGGIANFGKMPLLMEKATYDVIKTMLSQRIPNYSNKLAEFYTISDKNYYRKLWTNLDSTIEPVLGDASFTTWILTDAGYNYYKKEYNHTDEELQEARRKIRKTIGKYGFVQSKISYYSPANSEEDLAKYIEEILRYSKEEFLQLWSESPLVLKKANIIYDIIENELQFKL